MAKFRGGKEGFVHDLSMTMPTEPKTSESNKQKIAKIQDMFPTATKDHIAKILQFYENDENKVIDAFTRDGGIEALTNMADASSLKSKTTKNKKKKKKSKKDSGMGLTNTASFDADDSSSLHSGGNVEADIEKDCPRTENGTLTDIVDETENLTNVLSNHERLSGEDVELATSEVETLSFKTELKLSQEAIAAIPPEDLNPPSALISASCDKSNTESVPRVSPEKPEEHVQRREKYRPISESYSKQPQRQRTSSFRRNKSSSISEDSSSQYNPQAAAAPTKRGYDKCKKDLSRQTVSLLRIHSQLEKGFEDSEKRIKSVVADLQKKLENRQKELEAELAKKKIEAFDLLQSRRDLAVELKRRVDRTSSLTEAEWTELRADVKQFVTERKYDDDLGKTIWFQWSDVSEVISSLGEVQPVKNVYSQRSHAGPGSSAASNNPEPSPSSSLANDEVESSADKNDVGNISDAIEDEAPVVGKEEAPMYNKSQPSENRTSRTIYPSARYDPNRYNQGRYPNNRGYRGNRGGGGYQRSNNFRRNYNYNGRYSNYNNNNEEYKAHPPHSDREGRVNDNSMYSGGRNANNPRDNNKNSRNHGRHMNYGGYNPRYMRANTRGEHRQIPEHHEGESSANTANVNVEKSVVNGFTNN